ncbi:MAG TPA: ABATE domain-containing protein [Solirubrobacteraceae bacterium]|nr:ABATE domain-containing protein [Solirubrobacteraceae bacterium]
MQSLEKLPFIAGHVALDFVNTAEERGHPEAGDVLRTPADLRLWGQRYGLLSSSVREDRSELRRALSARELLYALFVARAHGLPLAPVDLAALSSLAAAAYRAAALTPAAAGKITWRWPPAQLSTIRHVAVTSAVDLLGGDPGPRLKQCPGDHCGWLFLDMTKRGNRRWCSMSECGQEAKTARRRALAYPGYGSSSRPTDDTA